MSLDDQLAEILGSLGVTMETAETVETADRDARVERAAWAPGATAGGREERQRPVNNDDWLDDWGDEPERDEAAAADLSLFQTSREHYGVFYRLDLVGGAPHLRVFAPDEEGALKMRCYLVRPVEGAPLRAWFRATRAHEGSEAYSAGRETIEQHLLFAAGEALKRLFWAGEPDRMRFPEEIAVRRVA